MSGTVSSATMAAVGRDGRVPDSTKGPSMAMRIRRILYRFTEPLRHDPAWFELASIMGAIGWGGLALISRYDFSDWPSMQFLSFYVGGIPPYLSIALGISQGLSVFGGFRRALALRARAAASFIASWWWAYLAVGIALSLPAMSMHVALYVVMSIINLMVMIRIGWLGR